MKLQDIVNNGFTIQAWSMSGLAGRRHVVLKLSKKTSRGERFYVAHSPHIDTVLANVEFSAPVLVD